MEMVMYNILPTKAGDVNQAAIQHMGLWHTRNEMFKDWYEYIILDDSELYQEDMETVIASDPKVFYKKARRLLSSGVTHSIPGDLLPQPDLVNLAPIVKFLDLQWAKKDRLWKRRGKIGWTWEEVSLLLATGWYDVLAYASPSDGLVAEIRNPIECFPKYDNEGLYSHFHIYSLPYEEAQRKCESMGW
ncbi:MAG: hypothetical protein KAJ19_22625, partial [Gammaproteobacteria bacterium]|nr:hypothetical protein [Gammaproteobacteria bacterium]